MEVEVFFLGPIQPYHESSLACNVKVGSQSKVYWLTNEILKATIHMPSLIVQQGL